MVIKKLFFIFILILINLSVLVFPQNIFARKIRIRGSGSAGGGSYSSVSIFPSRLGMVINFYNLNNLSKVSYVLSYFGSGQTQGVVGSFTPAASSDSRELLFGTCSRGACVYHEGVTNAHLVLNFTLKGGGVVTKRYLIKVHPS